MAASAYRTLTSPFVWRFAGRYLLPAWFLLQSVELLSYFAGESGFWLGLDARIYYRAAEAWLAGGDPWAVPVDGFVFAAPPPTLAAVAPFLLVGEAATAAIWVLGSLALAAWTLRRLRLPLWWLAFPPLVEAVWVGNFNVAVIALLVVGAPWASGAAGLLKVYAAVPLALLGRWRDLVVIALLVLVTAPVLPWLDYLRQAGAISATLNDQADGGRSALAFPVLVVPVVLSLVSLGRERAAWLAVPALWPATQSHYVLLALPVLHPAVAAMVATNQPAFLSLGIIAWALADKLNRRREARLATRRAPAPGDPRPDGVDAGDARRRDPVGAVAD